MDETDKDVAALDIRLSVSEANIDALEKAVAEKFLALRERTAAALEALRLSSEELSKSQEKRLEVLNEFRGSVNKIIDTLVTMVQFMSALDSLRIKISGEVNVLRAEYQGGIGKVQSEMDEIKLLRAKLDGAASQQALDETRKSLNEARSIMWISLGIGVLGFILTIIRSFKT